MSTLIVLGGAGGIVALATAIVVAGRGIFRQVTATDENTAATKELTGKMATLMAGFQDHETRITVLEDRIRR